MGMLISAIALFCRVLVFIIIAGAVMSWFIRPGDRLYSLYLFVQRLSDPILAPCRKLMGRFGAGMGIDFSPVIAILLIEIVGGLLIRLLNHV